MNPLRQGLDSLNGKPRTTYMELLTQISQEIPNTITLLEEANSSIRFNCHMFSLSVHTNSEIISLLKNGPHNLMVGSDFLNVLRRKQILVESQDGYLIVYFNKETPTHSGKLLEDGRVISKWGLDHLYNHGLWEVPASYGNEYKRFAMPKAADVVTAFREYSAPFMGKST